MSLIYVEDRVIEKQAFTKDELNEIFDLAALEIDQDATEDMRRAGNYKKGHVRYHGMGITLETGRGHTRSGVDAKGKAWSCKLKDHYGYIKLTESEADEDHIDLFIGDDPDSELIFVVNQHKPGGDFDEHKVLAGCYTKAKAKETYLRNYEDGWTGMGKVTPMTLSQFKWWIYNGNTKNPIEHDAFAKDYAKSAAEIGG